VVVVANVRIIIAGQRFLHSVPLLLPALPLLSAQRKRQHRAEQAGEAAAMAVARAAATVDRPTLAPTASEDGKLYRTNRRQALSAVQRFRSLACTGKALVSV